MKSIFLGFLFCFVFQLLYVAHLPRLSDAFFHLKRQQHCVSLTFILLSHLPLTLLFCFRLLLLRALMIILALWIIRDDFILKSVD